MKILELFGKKNVSGSLMKGVPYGIRVRFNPYRLVANKNDSVSMLLEIKNLAREPLLTSIVLKAQKKIGFDSSGLTGVREIRLGYLRPKDSKDLIVDVYGGHRTSPGEYAILITAFSHYRDYAHILNSEKKKVKLRVV